MEFVLIRRELSKDQYSEMTQYDLNKLVNYYNGRLVDIEKYADKVILVISAPSTWKTLLLSALLIPYRFI